ncbi:MAG: hypothetical protein JWP59_2574 [Massilia sp.]|nr:hypothetical protein [Massilia sp.]
MLSGVRSACTTPVRICTKLHRRRRVRGLYVAALALCTMLQYPAGLQLAYAEVNAACVYFKGSYV